MAGLPSYGNLPYTLIRGSHMRKMVTTAPQGFAVNKAERLEARITSAQKEILQRAAEIEGRSLTDFVVSAAHASARRIIHEQENLQLSKKDRGLFIAAL